jgi:HEAT repeat protein
MTARSVPARDADEATVEEFDRLVQQGADDADKEMILRLAETTRSPRVRNAAAIAMADLGIAGAGQLLVRLLGRDDTKGHRGTLLYALEELGEEVPLPVLVCVLLDGHYESREQALDLIGKEQIAFTMDQLDAAIAELSGLASSDDAYASGVGRTAVRWLKSLKRKRK